MDEESVTEAGELENDGPGIHRRSEERDGVSVRGNFNNFICYFLLRINGITRNNKNKIIRIRFITSCPLLCIM